jgi:hypothetical protein
MRQIFCLLSKKKKITIDQIALSCTAVQRMENRACFCLVTPQRTEAWTYGKCTRFSACENIYKICLSPGKFSPRLYKNCTFLWAVSSIRLCANCDVILRLTVTLTYSRVACPFCTELFFPTSILQKIGEERRGTLHCVVLCHEAKDMETSWQEPRN